MLWAMASPSKTVSYECPGPNPNASPRRVWRVSNHVKVLKMRSDAEFIKLLETEFGREKAEQLQALPYIDMENVSKVLWDTIFEEMKKHEDPIGSPGRVEAGRELEAQTVYALQHLPWSKFILRIPGPERENSQFNNHHAFILFGEKESKFSKEELPNVDDFYSALLAVSYRNNGVNKIVVAAPVAYDRKKGHTALPDLSHKQNQFPVQLLKIFEVTAIYALNYLALCPERIIETKSTEKPSRQQRKLADKDISQRIGLSTHILLDPTKAPNYQPPEMRAALSGIKRKPHARRSHWRRLPDRNVRVREAWIGPKDWNYQGRSYKVVQAHANSDES